MKAVVVVGALVIALAGCGRPAVTTRLPVFSIADARGPALRPGVWASSSSDCDYDPNTPAPAWPSCARADIVRAGEMARRGQGFEPYVLAGGYPRVLQVRETLTREDGAPAVRYLYDAMTVSRLDAAGRIVAARRWPVACPRLAENATPPDPCIAADPATLQVAARDENGPASWVWLRDGEQ